MRTFRSVVLTALAASTPLAAPAATDFSTYTADVLYTLPQVQAIAGASDSDALDGITLGPGGDLLVIHRDTAAVESIVRLATDATSGTLVRSHANILADLGAPYGPSLIIEGGFATSPDASTLYFGDTFSGEFALLSLGTGSTPTAAEVARSTDLDDCSDFAVLPTGEIAVVRGHEGLGYVDPAAGTPAWTLKVPMSVFQGLLSTADPTPAESIAVNPTNGDVWIFAHDVLELFVVHDLTSGSPTVEHVAVPGWGGVVDFHDLAVDENGIVFGFDEGSESIRIWDGVNAYDFALSDIATDLGLGAFDPALWRGITVRNQPGEVVELFLAEGFGNSGVARLTFAPASASVRDWNVYRGRSGSPLPESPRRFRPGALPLNWE